MIFLKQRKPMRRGGKRRGPGREQAGLKTYEERMDEITQWNIQHTDILRVLGREIGQGRLTSWSKALSIGIRRIIKGSGDSTGREEYESLRDLDQFIVKQRIKLLGNPTMREAKGIEKTDPLSVCIICGIRALQRERGLPGLMNTMKLKLLERYFGENPLRLGDSDSMSEG